jgi:UDP-3-O-[3-hydroxymyristoyl] glucosamine N-acyltransferase
MHNFDKPKTLGELAEFVGAEVVGDPNYSVEGVATLRSANDKSISFLTNSLYRKFLLSTKAGAVVLSEEFVDDCPSNVLLTSNPHAAYAKIAMMCLGQEVFPEIQIAESASIAKTAQVADTVVVKENVSIGEHSKIGAGTIIEAGVVVGDNVTLGENCHIHANVTLYHDITLGNRAVVHAGTVIGSDGFGFAHDNGKWIAVPQLGSVRIADDVDIGAHTTIDRGAIEDTIIHEGVKIDNQVQIGHNVEIGAHTVIAGCAAFAGSCKIGSYCLIGGGATFAGHITVCDQAQIAGMTTVTRSIETPGVYSSGTGMLPAKQWRKAVAHFRRLDKLAKRVKALEKSERRIEKVTETKR